MERLINTENYKNAENLKQNKMGSISKDGMTVQKRFPEYEFQVASKLKINKKRIIIITIIGAIISVAALIWLISSFGEEVRTGLCTLLLRNICLCVGLVTFIMGLIMCINKVWLITEKADYISQNRKYGVRGECCIFVKNEKFGVYKPFNAKIVIPAIYDKLTWQTRNKLIAESEGKTILIDNNGNKLS